MIIFGFSSCVFADSLKPLNQIATKSTLMNQDPVTIGYVFLRCSAAYAVMSTIGSERMNMPKKRTDEVMRYSTDYLAASIQLDQLNESGNKSKNKMTDTEVMQNSVDMQKRLIGYYFSELKAAKDKTGDYFSGNFLGDVEFCSSLGK